ncbi:MAG: DUF4956 domain-containing protein [Bacteroidia bacterium]|nr:DUF4956 domain-containing protein [Bacteroidia bacterium]
MTNIILQATEILPANEGLDALGKIISKFGIRFLINLVSVWVLIRWVYYPIYKQRELFFTYFIFNTIIFLICFLLNKVELSMGAAFGLFAVFSMLRYRTEDISMKDMTYLFMVIAMGLVAAVTKIKDADSQYEYYFLILINAVLILFTYLLEGKLFMKHEQVKTIYYENIALIKVGMENELIADISQRTGIEAHRVLVQKIDFLRDCATIKIYYYD